MRYTTSIPRRRGVIGWLEGRFAGIAIAAFMLLSGTFALATAILPAGNNGIVVHTASAEVLTAEAELRATLDSRMHLHLRSLPAPR